MGLESVTYINDLVPTNPDGAADNVDAGDDHIRNIKTGLKNSFPDVDQAVSTIIFSTTEPVLNRKGTLWGDETSNLLKLRNKGDTAWITLAASMLVSNSVDINAGSIDGTPIGAAAPSTGAFTTLDASGAANLLGTLSVTGLLTLLAGLNVTGNIIVSGTVDGRDVAADGTKLDGIEASADVNIALASQAEALAGTENTKTMTALRTEERIFGNISQGDLKTTTGEMSVTINDILVTGPGGEYGFWPTMKGAVSSFIYKCMPVDMQVTLGTSFLQRFNIKASNGTLTVQQRYVQASPPYDMGDGEVFSFIFAVINNGTGLIESMYHAPDPPWANNGPTNIRPDRIDPKTGKKYKTIQSIGLDKALLMNPDFIGESEIELTHAFKNSDMELIPHPFQGNNLTGKTVVLIDPMSSIVERLEAVKNSGGDAAEFLHGGYVLIGNEELNRGRPNGVMSVSVKMK